MLELFIKGGPIMWPLLLLSVAALAVVMERIKFLFVEASSRSLQDLHTIRELVSEGKIEKAGQVGRASKDLVARTLGEGLQAADRCFVGAVSCAAESELDRFERGIPLLDTAVTLAPLLGLLGTVTGMIRSFGLLGAAELDAPVAITGGIAEALIATAFGLGIAISALLPLNLLRAKKDRLAREIEDAASRMEIALHGRVFSVGSSQIKKAA